MAGHAPANGHAWVPHDPLAVVRSGDPDPFRGQAGTCGFRWWDHLDDPAHDPPYTTPPASSPGP